MSHKHEKETCSCPCDACQKCKGHSTLAEHLRPGDRVKWFDPEKNACVFGTLGENYCGDRRFGHAFFPVLWDGETSSELYDFHDFGPSDEGFIDRV